MLTINNNLDAATISTIKSTVDFLAENGLEITQLFYQKLFSNHPELKNVFNMAHQKSGVQQQALARAVYGFAAHLENLDAFNEQLSRIAHKHSSLNIQAKDYPIVGENLLAAINEIVREKLDEQTAEVITAAWQKAYLVFAKLLIEREQTLYQQAQSQTGGWIGLREFKILKREKESNNVTSFYLGPIDNQVLPQYKPGQYISLYIKPDKTQYQQIRQYSLSNSYDQNYYRISVKRDGIISSYLHDNYTVGDRVSITPPAGDFTLQTPNNNPIVLLSAGIGVTPIISLLNTVLQSESLNPVTFVHAVQNSAYHPFKKFIEQTAIDNSDRFNPFVFYEKPLDSDASNKDFHFHGLIDLEKIKENIQKKNTDYYLCGPIPFMSSIYKTISSWGVDKSNIHYEIFGADKALN